MAKLLVLAHRVPYPPNKGEKLRTFHQIEALVKNGHSVSVLAPYDSEGELDDAKALAAKFNLEVVCKKLPHKIIRLALAVLKNRSFSEANFSCAALASVFSDKMKSADSVLLTASSLAPYVLNIAKTSQAKPQLLMDFMDVDSDKWRQYADESTGFKKWLYSREASKIAQLEIATSEAFDTVFVIADTEKKLFESSVVNKGNVKVLGNGIDQALFNPSEEKPSSSTNYLFSGVMDYKPNIDAMLWFVKHCWPNIINSVPNAHLIIAGMNPSAEILKLGGLSNIEVTGFVDDIKPYFDSAHIFVAPFQIARGVQNKVLQAMACALPVVSSPLGAEGIACKDGIDILLAGTPGEFSQRCIELAHNANLNAQIGQQALTTINENYGWESVLQPLTQALSQANARA